MVAPSPSRFVERLSELGIRLIAGVPCSVLAPLIDAAEQSRCISYVSAANEAEAVAIAAGATVSGWPAGVLCQNSGFANALDPLTSLCLPYEIPLLFLVSWRGQPGSNDAPHHAAIGTALPRLLDLLEVPWRKYPSSQSECDELMAEAKSQLIARRSFAVVVPNTPPLGAGPRAKQEIDTRGKQHDPKSVLEAIVSVSEKDDILVSTTGYTSRLLYSISDRNRNFYLSGSLGCAAPFALGVALQAPDTKVTVIDGDGSLLMHLGSLATIGNMAPPNLAHLLLDNGVHASTGGQRTAADQVDFSSIAKACGYPVVVRKASVPQVCEFLRSDARGPVFFHVRVKSDVSPAPRPPLIPREIAERFGQAITGRG